MSGGCLVPDSVFDSTVSILVELCSISSASGDLAGLNAMAQAVGSALEELGLAFEVAEHLGLDGRQHPVLVARGPRQSGRCTLALGHLDTVLPGIQPTAGSDRVNGTGALDMKGGVAALIGALRMMRHEGRPAPEDLLFVGVPDEEVGGPISEHLVRTYGAEAHTVLVLEPGELRGERETLVTGRRGLLVWRLEATGKAAHSGLAYWDGRSALAAAAAWSAKVQRLSSRDSGVIVNVGRIVGGDSDFVQDLGEEHHFVGTTQRLNVVADRCIAEGEVRFLEPEQRAVAVAAMHELAADLADEWGVTFHLEEVESLQPVSPGGPGAELAERLVRFAATDGWALELEADRGGVSFPNFLPDPSAVAVVDGLGPCGDGMHTREEYVDLRSLRRRIALIAEALDACRGRG